MKLFLCFLFLAFFISGKAQKNLPFPVDTSFTLNATYKKELKNYPFIKPVYPVLPSTVVVKRDMVYANYQGREMHIDVYSPKDIKEPKPLILFVFGGGWISGNKILEAPMAMHFAKLGYITATVEYRLSLEAKYPAAVFDVKTAIRWLRKNSKKLHFNPDKIVISGTSAGGQLAALIGSTNNSEMYIDSTFYSDFSSNVQAVIDIDGVLAFIHPESGEGQDKPGKLSAATSWFGGNMHEKTDLWNEASALTHVNKDMPPILFINSQHPRFHSGRDDMIKILNSHNIYSEVHTLPDTPHPFWLFEPWYSPTVEYMEGFLKTIGIEP